MTQPTDPQPGTTPEGQTPYSQGQFAQPAQPAQVPPHAAQQPYPPHGSASQGQSAYQAGSSYPAPGYQGTQQGSGWSLAGTGPLAPENQRNWAMACHAIPLALMVLSGGLAAWVAPIVTYFLLRDRGDFVRRSATEALNFQIVVGIGLLVSVALMPVLVGFITYPIIWVGAVVLHVIAAMKAYRGEPYHYPMTPSFVK